MKTHPLNRLALALAGLLYLSQASAWARPGPGDSNDCAPNCERSNSYNGRGANDRRGPQNRSDRSANGHDNRRPDGERGAGPDQSFHRGERLPPGYRSRQYVVDDWRGHGLRPPPRGYHWVQTGGDYVLVAITTGLILDLLLSH